MKTKLIVSAFFAFLLLSYGCSKNESNDEQSGEQSGLASHSLKSSSKDLSASKNSSVISQPYSQAQAEVLETFGEIGAIVKEGAGSGYDGDAMDQLIAFHAYGDKFVEFNGGKLYNSAGNEINERQTFGVDVTEVIQFAAIPGSMKVAVYYGNVANVTFISDFIVVHKDYGEITINDLITLLFVKTEGKWKMVHEHHSKATDLSIP